VDFGSTTRWGSSSDFQDGVDCPPRALGIPGGGDLQTEDLRAGCCVFLGLRKARHSTPSALGESKAAARL